MTILPCPSGDCPGDLQTQLATNLSSVWPSAKVQVEAMLHTILSAIGTTAPMAYKLPNSTLPKDFRAIGWPSGLPNAVTYPILMVIVDGNLWVAPNNTAFDIGTVPSTPGTGTKWLNVYADIDVQIASAVPYAPTGAYSGLWPATAPVNVQQALDSIARTFSYVTALPKAQVYGSSAAGGLTYVSANKATFFVTISFDALSMWSVANNQFTIPASQGGEYLLTFSGGVISTAGNTSAPQIWFRKNSETLVTYGLGYYTWSAWVELGTYYNFGGYSTIRTLAAGDTISLWHQVNGNVTQQAVTWMVSLVKLN